MTAGADYYTDIEVLMQQINTGRVVTICKAEI
jgi:hypothetical protein